MQALDRLAAAVIISGGFEIEAAGDVYWTTLESLAEEAMSEKPKPAGKRRVSPLGYISARSSASLGRSRGQLARLRRVADDQLIWPFYKQPKWSSGRERPAALHPALLDGSSTVSSTQTTTRPPQAES
jgi:hypothetical protein